MARLFWTESRRTSISTRCCVLSVKKWKPPWQVDHGWQSTGRIFLHTRVPSSGNQSARTFQLFGRRGASTRYCSKPGYEPRYGFSNCLHGAGAPCAFGQITAEISSGMNLTLPATLEMKLEHLQRTGPKNRMDYSKLKSLMESRRSTSKSTPTVSGG